MANYDRWNRDQERNRSRGEEMHWRDRDHGRARRLDPGYLSDPDTGSRNAGSRRDLDRGGRYGAEGYGGAYQDGRRGGSSRRFGGNDYDRSFYGADQGYRGDERGPRQDAWGYRGERSGWDRFSDEVTSWFGDEDAERRRQRDAMQGDQGARYHRGRGPKGYVRSDERIREDVNDRLTDDPHIDASDIEVSVSDREVTLNGTVNSRFEKRHAEDIADSVSGVTHVQNNLRIQQGTAAGTSGSIGIGSTTGAAATGLSGERGGTTDPSRRRTRAAT